MPLALFSRTYDNFEISLDQPSFELARVVLSLRVMLIPREVRFPALCNTFLRPPKKHVFSQGRPGNPQKSPGYNTGRTK